MKAPATIHRRRIAIALPAVAFGFTAGCSQVPPAQPVATAPAPAPSAAQPAWTDKPVFSIVDIQIHDGKGFGEYVAGHTATIAQASLIDCTRARRSTSGCTIDCSA